MFYNIRLCLKYENNTKKKLKVKFFVAAFKGEVS